MMHIFFNSTDPACREPVGAIPVGQGITFTLHLPAEYGTLSPRLIIHRDGQPQAELIMEMHERGADGTLYRVRFMPGDVGLYFYHFDLYSDFRKIYRGKLGEGYLSWESGPEWQITVYDKDFATPECYKGGVQYQIFPDRFKESRPKPMPFADRVYRANKHGEPYFWPTETGGSLNLDYFGGEFAGIQEKLPYLSEPHF